MALIFKYFFISDIWEIYSMLYKYLVNLLLLKYASLSLDT